MTELLSFLILSHLAQRISSFGYHSFHQSCKCLSVCLEAHRRDLDHHLPPTLVVHRRYVVAGFLTLTVGSESRAAPPISYKDTQTLGAMAQRFRRPKPPKLLRQRLSQDFAVLLMRSSYNVLDQLDCVAMDQFQRDFFIIRQSEYEPYIKNLGLGMVQQGDLTDPYYFDFISFAQYVTIDREITLDPPFVFEEQQPVDQGEDQPQKFVPVIIRRDPDISNEMLPYEHDRRVGEAILDRFEEIFGVTGSAIPKIKPGSRPGANTLLASLKQLINLFLVNGYAFGGSATISTQGYSVVDARGTQFCLSLNAPANIWSEQALSFQSAKVTNNFLLKAASVLVRRAGYSVKSTVTKYEGSRQDTLLTIA